MAKGKIVAKGGKELLKKIEKKWLCLIFKKEITMAIPLKTKKNNC
jgi:Fe-S cluster assembly ATPase SufC